MAGSPDRKQRLAAQLRENLKRRKAQARARDAVDNTVAEPSEPADDAPVAPAGEVPKTLRQPMQSKAETVDAFMDELDPPRRAALDRLRTACRAAFPDWHEHMRWGMPGYAPEGRDPIVAFNSQKNHIAFYVGPTAVERFADRLGGIDCGKGCIRYRRPEQIDEAVVSAILADIRARNPETMC